MNDDAWQDYERYLLIRGQAWKEELERFDSGAVAEVLRGMRNIRRLVDVELSRLDRLDPADVLEGERLQRLSAWLDSVTAAGVSVVDGVALEAGIQAALASATAAVSCLSIDGALAAVRDVGLTREQVAVWFRPGTDLLDHYSYQGLLGGMAEDWRQTVLDSLRVSVTMGRGTAESVNALLADAMEDGLLLAERDAISIVRTGIQSGAVQAIDAVYEANADLLRGWRWIAKLDSRTCPVCAALDGRSFKVGEGPRIPRHLRCRCLRQPLLRKNADLGLPDEDVQRLSRRWIEREAGNIDLGGRRVVATQGTDRWFGEFFGDLRPDLQDRMLGPTRAQALRAGQIKWQDLVTQKGKFRTLDELGLKKKERGK